MAVCFAHPQRRPCIQTLVFSNEWRTCDVQCVCLKAHAKKTPRQAIIWFYQLKFEEKLFQTRQDPILPKLGHISLEKKNDLENRHIVSNSSSNERNKHRAWLSGHSRSFNNIYPPASYFFIASFCRLVYDKLLILCHFILLICFIWRRILIK